MGGLMKRDFQKLSVFLFVIVSFFIIQSVSAQGKVETRIVYPDPEIQGLAPKLSLEEYERLLELKEKIHEDMLRREQQFAVPAPPGLPLEKGKESKAIELIDTQTHPLPGSSLVIPRNVYNTCADSTSCGGSNSTLAEPAAINEGLHMFSAGNFAHAEFSLNGGTSFTNVPIPAGPADASIACCDNDVVFDRGRGLTIWSLLYINGAATNGVVRLFIRRTVDTQACSYTIDEAGTANNILMDFPHMAVSNDFLYLASNDIVGGATQDARIRRIPLDTIYDCLPITMTNFSWPFTTEGQKVWRPYQGATETMYWSHISNATTLRIFSWPESAGAPTNVTRVIAASTFGNPDCSGGTGNFDWFDATAGSSIGFQHVGAVGGGRIAAYWDVAADAMHTQGHIHSAVYDETGLTLLAQPHIFNNTFCFGNPNVTTNRRGNLGMILALGGNAGGVCTGSGCLAARPAVGEDDDFTTGLGFFGSFIIVANGTDNRSDSRFGDYFTIQPHVPCDLFFFAAGYALNGGAGTANVNYRLVDFGRNRDRICYNSWFNDVR